MTTTAKTSSDRRAERISNLSPVDQIEKALKFKTVKQGIAFAVGAVVGCLIPVLTYRISHIYALQDPKLWVLATAGLAYSSMTVYQWACAAFKYPVKAAGFVILLELYMTLVEDHYGTLACLGILCFINACSAACWLSLNKKGSDME